MKWTKEAGKDPLESANAMMAGANLGKVRECLADMGVPGAEIYSFTPPALPGVSVSIGHALPGDGGANF